MNKNYVFLLLFLKIFHLRWVCFSFFLRNNLGIKIDKKNSKMDKSHQGFIHG